MLLAEMKSSASLYKFTLVFINLVIVFTKINGTLINITSQVFGSNANGIIAAFGDFNSDKLTDLFVIADKGKELRIFLASNELPYLKPSTIKCSIDKGLITSVAPGDFNGDSHMDVLITIAAESDTLESTSTFRILWGNQNNINCTSNSEATQKIIGQPLLLDFNGDKIPDILGIDANSKRKVWIGSKWQNNITAVDFPDGGNASFKIPHSHAFIDLSSDMIPDLLLTTESGYEMWHNENGNYIFKEYAENPSVALIGQSVFFDFDLDGTMDHLVPVCYTSDCSNSSILIRKNKKWVQLSIHFENEQVQWGFITPSKNVEDLGMNTITVRVGDYDFDGYPDLLAILKPITGSTKGNTVFLMHNEYCSSCPIGRQLSIIWDFGVLQSVDALFATFYDVYNDGILDILVAYRKDSSNWGLQAFQNYYDNNACFIKVIVLSGLCYTDCPNKTLPYGVNQPGPSICYNTTTIEGAPQASCAGQLSQSAYFSLQLPYVVFGLGHTPNFVDMLHVGVPSIHGNQSPHTHSWPSIIPNSQMFVIPSLAGDRNRWINKLFVTPSQLVLITFAALVGTMGFILLIILGLHLKERREDKKEKLQESHRFHFDAM